MQLSASVAISLFPAQRNAQNVELKFRKVPFYFTSFVHVRLRCILYAAYTPTYLCMSFLTLIPTLKFLITYLTYLMLCISFTPAYIPVYVFTVIPDFPNTHKNHCLRKVKWLYHIKYIIGSTS